VCDEALDRREHPPSVHILRSQAGAHVGVPAEVKVGGKPLRELLLRQAQVVGVGKIVALVEELVNGKEEALLRP